MYMRIESKNCVNFSVWVDPYIVPEEDVLGHMVTHLTADSKQEL